MTEMDTTLFGGASGAPYEELRAKRQAITAYRHQIVNQYYELAKMDPDRVDNNACDFDENRRKLWQMVVDYVDLARLKFELGQLRQPDLNKVANSLEPMTHSWNKTRYYYTTHGYGAQPFPTREDVFRPLPNTGVNRETWNFSNNTDFNYPHGLFLYKAYNMYFVSTSSSGLIF